MAAGVVPARSSRRTARSLHALDRLTFGPRPGDVERVEKMGLKKWIDAQLHPERIPENPILAEKLAAAGNADAE